MQGIKRKRNKKEKTEYCKLYASEVRKETILHEGNTGAVKLAGMQSVKKASNITSNITSSE